MHSRLMSKFVKYLPVQVMMSGMCHGAKYDDLLNIQVCEEVSYYAVFRTGRTLLD